MENKQEQFFSKLYEEWFSKLCTYANARINNLPVAEEVVQDTFLVALLGIDKLINAENPERWSKKTVKNKLLHYFRDNGRRLDRVIPLDDIEKKGIFVLDPKIEQLESSEEERLNDIKGILEKTLKEAEKELVRKIVFEEKTYEEVAQELGISLWACQKRMQRLREKIRKAMADYHND